MGGRGWPIIPLVEGPDWVTGNTFFIRNKRQPTSYWSTAKNRIVPKAPYPDLIVSSSTRYKFRICMVDNKDEHTVLNRSDRITVSLLDREWVQTKLYVALAENNMLVLSTVKMEWKFGDFFSRFGTYYTNNQEYLLASEGFGDEWELC
jgi:hypothetical protein